MAYNIEWSRGVVLKFQEKHQESCKRIEDLYKMKPAVLVLWLMTNDKRWPKYKKLINYDEKSYHITREYYEGNEKLILNHLCFDQYYRKHLERISLDPREEQLDLGFDPA